MLTYPSDSLPQIVCPMEEDAIPPNPFCSAPPHSESPPPHPSLSSVTPSFENNGKFRNRRSGRLQGFQDPTPKKQRLSRQNPPPTKGERESGMVQWSLSAKQSRGKTLHEQKVKQNKDALHFDGWSECTTKHDDQTNRRAKGNIFATENGDKQFAGATSQDLDTSQSQTTCIDMDECAELAVEQPVEKPSLTKGWVIGPLFQSFKSKMASFSEIVMSPVKLFKAHTPLSRDQTDDLNLSHALCSEHSESTTEIQEQQTNENSKGVTQDFNVSSFGSRHQELDDQVSSPSAQIRFADVRCEKHFVDTAARNSQILCDGDSSTHSLPSVKECAFTEKESNTIQSVPLKHSPFRHDSPEKNLNSSKSVVKTSGLFQSSNNSGASCPSKQKKSGKMEEKKDNCQGLR
ncbi:uncharacterized protein LOC130119807 [Lampris incognitus]|uniref:uncharacterized protein LOC130119807 n=1 Tax=Lampris incognitus TaxID=2546036 RepID=UPI0024B61BAE|nr:uncharacterized protein LOC130119807 [Lampris incognitus]